MHSHTSLTRFANGYYSAILNTHFYPFIDRSSPNHALHVITLWYWFICLQQGDSHSKNCAWLIRKCNLNKIRQAFFRSEQASSLNAVIEFVELKEVFYLVKL